MVERKMGRREFMRISALAAAGVVGAACAPTTDQTPTKEKPSDSNICGKNNEVQPWLPNQPLNDTVGEDKRVNLLVSPNGEDCNPITCKVTRTIEGTKKEIMPVILNPVFWTDISDHLQAKLLVNKTNNAYPAVVCVRPIPTETESK